MSELSSLHLIICRIRKTSSKQTVTTIMSTNGTELPKIKYQNLGASGLKVSKVIVGCMSYGTPDWQEWVLDEEK